MLNLTGQNVDISGSGDHVVVAGTPGMVTRIFRIVLTFKGGAPTVKFRSGATQLPGTFHMKDGGSIALGMERRRWAATSPGEDFIINLSENCSVAGALTIEVS